VDGDVLIFRELEQLDVHENPEPGLKEQVLPSGSPLRQVILVDRAWDEFEDSIVTVL